MRMGLGKWVSLILKIQRGYNTSKPYNTTTIEPKNSNGKRDIC